jgi:hypothetical protein
MITLSISLPQARSLRAFKPDRGSRLSDDARISATPVQATC